MWRIGCCWLVHSYFDRSSPGYQKKKVSPPVSHKVLTSSTTSAFLPASLQVPVLTSEAPTPSVKRNHFFYSVREHQGKYVCVSCSVKLKMRNHQVFHDDLIS